MILDSTNGVPFQRIDRRFGEGDVRCVAFLRTENSSPLSPAARNRPFACPTWPREASRRLTVGHTGDVNAVAFSADGRTLATGGTDGTVMLWKVPVPIPASQLMTAVEAWESLDTLETKAAYQHMGTWSAQPSRAVAVIGEGFRGSPTSKLASAGGSRNWITTSFAPARPPGGRCSRPACVRREP